MLIDGLRAPQRTIRLRLAVGLVAGGAALLALLAQLAGAQTHAHAAEAPAVVPGAPAHVHTLEDNGRLHMEMSPMLRGTSADSARACRRSSRPCRSRARFRPIC